MSTANSDYYVIGHQLFFDLESATRYCNSVKGGTIQDIHTGTKEAFAEARTICNIVIPAFQKTLNELQKSFDEQLADCRVIPKGRCLLEDMWKADAQMALG